MNDLYLPTPAAPGLILAVDDQPDVLRLLALELSASPFKIVQAITGAEALGACRKEAFEGILMDVSLPDMTGFDACRRIHATPLNGNTPLIYLSGSKVGEESMVEGLEAGGVDYLTKPCPFPELLAKLRMMVRLSRQQRALMDALRHQALVEVAGGAAHELSQPLATAQLILDQWELKGTPPSPKQMAQFQELLAKVTTVLHQFQNLKTYVTKPYPTGTILDLEESRKASEPPQA